MNVSISTVPSGPRHKEDLLKRVVGWDKFELGDTPVPGKIDDGEVAGELRRLYKALDIAHDALVEAGNKHQCWTDVDHAIAVIKKVRT